MSAENRSEWAVLASALAAPILLWGCGASWLWLLAGGAAGTAVYALICYLQPEQDLTALTRGVFGNKVGTLLLWLQLGALALGMGFILRQTDPVVPNIARGYPWIPVVLCALALAGAWRGRKATLASGAVLFWLIFLTVAAVVLFSLPQIRAERILPKGDAVQCLPAAAIFLLPVLCLYCRKPEAKRKSIVLQAVMLLVGVLIVFVTSGCLSPRLAAKETLPFFTLAASCSLLGHAARFDAVLCMTVCAAVYCLLGLMLNFCRQLVRKKECVPMIVFIVLTLLASWVVPEMPGWESCTYLVATWAILPVCCVVFDFLKKLQKNEKSC